MTEAISENKKFNLWLKLGILNHIIYLTIIFLGCALSNFTCHGDSMGGIMMVYALVLFVPQIIFEVVVFVQLLIASPSVKIIKPKLDLIIWFALTFLAIVISNYTI